MDLRISLAGEDGEDQTPLLESLASWLRSTPELAGRVTDVRVPAAGELGALSDALVVSVGSGGTLSVLVLSLKAWLAQPRRSKIRIRVENEDGRIVEVDADRIGRDQVEAIIRHAIEGGFPEN